MGLKGNLKRLFLACRNEQNGSREVCFTGHSNLRADSLEKERGLVGRRRKRKWFFPSSDCPLMFPLNVMNEKLKEDTECMSACLFSFSLTAIRSYYGTM